MKDMNFTFLIGRLTRDPETKYTQSGKAITTFSIANNGFKDQEVSYFDIQVWDKQAENCGKYLKKGSQIAIGGTLKQDRWDDKTSGQKRSKIIINANTVQFLDKIEQPKEQPIDDPWAENIQGNTNPEFADGDYYETKY